MANLLDQASIVLTPTAYDNGKVLCAKPSEAPYGDFDFSRNSAATRVNAQGLVENVQILSSNLVQNGDFSEEGVQEVSNGSFSQEGVQLVTNGDFSSDTAWVKGTGTTISGGSANFVNADGVSLYQSIGNQSGFVKITFNVTDYTSGTLNVYSGGNQSVSTINVSANALGTYTAYVDRNGGNVNIIFGSSENFTGSIDNVSVREVGQDWTLGGEVTIGDNLAHFESNTNTYSYIRQDISSLTSKTYKIQLEVKNYVSGAVQVAFSGASPIAQNLNVSTDGVYTAYLTPNANGDDFEVSREFNGGNFNFDITNISVKEVGQNWVLGNGWSIAENKAVVTNASELYQRLAQPSLSFTLNSTYEISITCSEYSSGFLYLRKPRGTEPDTSLRIDNVGTFVFTLKALTELTEFALAIGSIGTDLSISNISIIEITDDTNLPRINYEGFSYQDALGSELVVNGDFSNGSTGWLNVGQQNANNTNTFSNGKVILVNDGTGSGISQPNILEIGKTYEVEIVVSEIVGNGFKIYTGTDYFITNTGTFTLQVTSTINNVFYLYRNQTNPQAINGATIDNVSVKEYLGQEVVPDSGCGSWLFEPQSTNLITYSEDFSQWSQTFTNVGTNELVSPDGTLNASKITATSTSQPRVEQSFSVPSVDTKNTFSVFVKKGNTSYIALSRFSGSQSAIFDLDTISIVSQSSENATIKEMGNGWFKISITQTVLSTDTYNVWKINLTNGISTNVGVVGEYVYIWGAQLEQQSYATSYIPTSGSTVTRNQDVCTNGGSLASINSTEGTLYFEGAALANDGTSRVICLSDGTNSHRVLLSYTPTTNQIQGFHNNGVDVINLIFVVSDITNFHKFAFKYSLNDFALWVDGVEVGTNFSGTTNIPNTLNELKFENASGSSDFFGKTKALAVFPYLSDAELTELTTI